MGGIHPPPLLPFCIINSYSALPTLNKHYQRSNSDGYCEQSDDTHHAKFAGSGELQRAANSRWQPCNYACEDNNGYAISDTPLRDLFS
ncbi:hypothetical protein sS8_2697 [Methylocaldum marinum]|uniref:Uncharacterized protein n=1 Tax=Methylocaldum marinum TaxID=1432792 RepID=A0A250KT05_9GAMM|nr:hypothetical protein sS8_2697 [Methylocaldum marinum]